MRVFNDIPEIIFIIKNPSKFFPKPYLLLNYIYIYYYHISLFCGKCAVDFILPKNSKFTVNYGNLPVFFWFVSFFLVYCVLLKKNIN